MFTQQSSHKNRIVNSFLFSKSQLKFLRLSVERHANRELLSGGELCGSREKLLPTRVECFCHTISSSNCRRKLQTRSPRIRRQKSYKIWNVGHISEKIIFRYHIESFLKFSCMKRFRNTYIFLFFNYNSTIIGQI